MLSLYAFILTFVFSVMNVILLGVGGRLSNMLFELYERGYMGVKIALWAVYLVTLSTLIYFIYISAPEGMFWWYCLHAAGMNLFWIAVAAKAIDGEATYYLRPW